MGMFSEAYILNRFIEVIGSCNRPTQTLVAQQYCHLLINKIDCPLAKLRLIDRARDMITVKIQQWINHRV